MIQKKVCMVGVYGTGKTSLVQRYVHSIFSVKYHSTVRVKIDRKLVRLGDTTVNLLLWDIEGRTPEHDIPASYLRGAHAVFFVADGIGGAADGELASGVAVSSVVEYLAGAVDCVQDFDVDREQTFLDILSTAVWRGHERLKEMFPRPKGPATTLTLATLVWPRAYVVHVGDSRGYYLRNGALRQFTRDQTMGDYLVDIGAVTEQHAQKAGMYDVLSSEVGGYLVPSVGVVDLAEGDAILLCTDGLTKNMTDDRIAALLAAGDAESAAQSLIDSALEGGGRDNVTVVVARATGASHSPS